METVQIVTRKESVIGLELSKDAKTFSIAHTMATSFLKIQEKIKEDKLQAGSLVYTRYRDINWVDESTKGFFAKFLSIFTKVWKMDMGFEVPTLQDAPSGFTKGTIEAGSYLQYKHIGPYSKLTFAYKKVTAFALENNIELDSVVYDIYLNNPHSVPRKELQTLVLAKIKAPLSSK